MADLQATQITVSEALDRIKAEFKEGSKIAVLVWFPDFPERDFVMTDGSLDEAAEVIERRKRGAAGR